MPDVMKRKDLMRFRTLGLVATGLVTVCAASAVLADIQLYNVVTGEPLSLQDALPEGKDPEAVKTFMAPGVNIYNEDPATLPQGEEVFLTACSGCHGHYAEGKIGPGLNDDYWTYPENKTDEGLFRTIYGGAHGQMGPQYGSLTLDEMLLAMSWIRHIYTGDPKTATWLSPEQRQSFTPYQPKPSGSEG